MLADNITITCGKTELILFLLLASALPIFFYIRNRKQNQASLQNEDATEPIIETEESKLKSIRQEKALELYEEVTQSINTARRIQQSYLPTEAQMKEFLPKSFVLYLPKDIVSGDFYWMHMKYDKIYLAAVDCTGHGVAGAFMSIIGRNLLTQIVSDYPAYSAAEILVQLSKDLIKTLHQDTDEATSNEGMELALCIIDKDENTIQFAGANNPLYLYRNKELQKIKPDGRGIGLLKGNKDITFTNNNLEMEQGDTYYIFSDGYPCQFGGPTGEEKMKYNRFRDILEEVHHMSIERQKEAIHERLLQWQGSVEQTDDIMVIGFCA